MTLGVNGKIGVSVLWVFYIPAKINGKLRQIDQDYLV